MRAVGSIERSLSRRRRNVVTTALTCDFGPETGRRMIQTAHVNLKVVSASFDK
jgi:hypothetical protein